MADRDVSISVRFKAFEKLTEPLRRIGAASRVTGKDLAATRKEARALEQRVARVGAYRDLQNAIGKTHSELDKARRSVREAREEIARTTGPVEKLTARMNRAQQKAGRLGDRLGEQTRRLDALGDEMKDAGIDTRRLTDHEAGLTRQLDATNKKLAEQKRQYGKLIDQRKRAERMRATGDKLGSVGRSATMGVTAPIAAIGFAAGRETIAFNDQMASVSTLVDDATESMDRMKAEVLDLGKRTPVPLSDLTGALYDIRSAGMPAANQMMILEKSAKLGVAGLGSTGEAADIATSAINAFGLKGHEQERVFDLFFKAVKHGKTNIRELSQGFGDVAGVMKNAGIPLDEFLASVTAVTTSGVKSSVAYTQLRAAVSGLTRDTTASRKVFSALGAKDMKDLIAKSGGLVPALSRIKSELKGNDAAILSLFGSIEAYNAAISLTGEQNDAYTETLRDMRKGANALEPAYAKKKKEDAARIITDMNRIRAASIKIGAIIVPIFAKFMDYLAGLADGFSNLSPGVQTFFVGIGAILGVIGPLLIFLAKLIWAFGYLAPVLRNLAGGFRYLLPVLRMLAGGFRMVVPFIRLLVGGLGWVVRIIATAVTAIAGFLGWPVWVVAALAAAIAVAGYLIWKHFDWIKEKFSAFWNWLSGIYEPGYRWFINLHRMMFIAVGQAVMKGLDFIVGIWRQLQPRFAEIGANLIRGLIGGILGMLGRLKSTIVGAARSAAAWFKEKLGIHSPSRVFMGFGDNIMTGLAIGLDRGSAKPLARIRDASAQLTRRVALGAAAASAVASPATARAVTPSPSAQFGDVHFHIKQQPGQSAADLAEQIRVQLEKLERRKRADRNASYADEDQD